MCDQEEFINACYYGHLPIPEKNETINNKNNKLNIKKRKNNDQKNKEIIESSKNKTEYGFDDK